MEMKPKELATIFGQNVRKIRIERGLKQVDFARELGVPQSHISAIETGNRMANIKTFANIAEKLGVEPSQLLSQQCFSVT